MPIAYVTSPPDEDSLQVADVVEEMLIDQGWTPQLSPAMLNKIIHSEAWCPGPKLVSHCLEALRRAEALMTVGRWRSCELCRIERAFAKANDLICTEATGRQFNIPDASTFGEKYLQIHISHNCLHAHPSNQRRLAAI